MKKLLTLTAVVVFFATALPAQSQMDGNWWTHMTPGFKLGWVTGYAKAMDQAFSLNLGTCLSNLPLYKEKWPTLDANAVAKMMCFGNNEFDYDGIAMGQFVDGIDTFYSGYRNRQLDVTFAIEYVRDTIKGKSAQDLETEVTLWRKCTAATQTNDRQQIKEACYPGAAARKSPQ